MPPLHSLLLNSASTASRAPASARICTASAPASRSTCEGCTRVEEGVVAKGGSDWAIGAWGGEGRGEGGAGGELVGWAGREACLTALAACEQEVNEVHVALGEHARARRRHHEPLDTPFYAAQVPVPVRNDAVNGPAARRSLGVNAELGQLAEAVGAREELAQLHRRLLARRETRRGRHRRIRQEVVDGGLSSSMQDAHSHGMLSEQEAHVSQARLLAALNLDACRGVRAHVFFLDLPKL